MEAMKTALKIRKYYPEVWMLKADKGKGKFPDCKVGVFQDKERVGQDGLRRARLDAVLMTVILGFYTSPGSPHCMLNSNCVQECEQLDQASLLMFS